jgi:hypothetical protein
MKLCNVLVLHPSFYGLLNLKMWWPLDLSSVMNVSYLHGEKTIMKICHFNTLFSTLQVENVILFIFQLSKFIVFIFRLFQNSKLIKYVMKHYNIITSFVPYKHVVIYHTIKYLLVSLPILFANITYITYLLSTT